MLKIKSKIIPFSIIQGGMGVGVSRYNLASAVAREGGVGVLSSACLDYLIFGKRGKIYDAVFQEVSMAKEMAKGGFIGINIMVALTKDYNDSVRAAIDAKADFIICGAGLPIGLPGIQEPKDTALIPIVSSPQALDIICRKWAKLGYQVDAAVLEGPLAGGHLGFKPISALYLQENKLENLLGPVKDVAKKHGDFPVIAAGGIYESNDIKNIMRLGADGVQMGTRFLVTEESSATLEYKKAVLSATKQEDIVVADGVLTPGSPCRLPFVVIKQSLMYISALSQKRTPKCDKGYVLQKDAEGKFTVCPAKQDNKNFICICNGLISSAGYEPNEEPVYTIGAGGYVVGNITQGKILKVHDVMNELKQVLV